MAQRANTCFFCGGSLDAAPRARRSIPWADIVLFLSIGALLVFWWVRAPGEPDGQQVAQLRGPATGGALVPLGGTITSTPFVQPTKSRPSDTPTLRATETPAPTKTPVPTPLRHKVEAGESFGIIADKYGSTIKDIIEANSLTADSMIHPGDELIIPVAGASGGAGPTPTPAGGTLLYSVQPGDTISEIAERFGSRMDWILDANKRKATDMLLPGDRLLIPLSNITPTPMPRTTPTIVPTPSATEDTMQRAPILLSPAGNDEVSGSAEVMLRWAASVVLGKDHWYVVTVKVLDSDALVAPYWTKGTTWRLSPDYREPDTDATRFSWQVQVYAGAPSQPNPKIVSLPSETRTFTWTK